jgi:hypothetical protein
MSKKATKTNLELGTEIFDNYLNAKKTLTSRIKAVLDILTQCNSLDVEPKDAAKWVARETTKVSSHQWQYNAGHETIYCQHMYDFRGSFNKKCTVKLPVRFLGMTDEEILKENREAAIKALEEQRKALEDSIVEVSKPINDKIGKIDEQIEALKKEPANENV